MRWAGRMDQGRRRTSAPGYRGEGARHDALDPAPVARGGPQITQACAAALPLAVRAGFRVALVHTRCARTTRPGTADPCRVHGLVDFPLALGLQENAEEAGRPMRALFPAPALEQRVQTRTVGLVAPRAVPYGAHDRHLGQPPARGDIPQDISQRRLAAYAVVRYHSGNMP